MKLLVSHLHSREDVHAGATTREDAVALRQRTAHGEGIIVRHGEHLVHEAEIHAARNVALAHALNEERLRRAMRASGVVFRENGTLGVGQHVAHAPAGLLLEAAPHACVRRAQVIATTEVILSAEHLRALN